MPKKATAKRPDAGAPCPIMHSCGGCAWLGLPYRKQLARKHTACLLYTSDAADEL